MPGLPFSIWNNSRCIIDGDKETANIVYRLSFADQGKQTSIFCLQKTNGSCVFRWFHFPNIYIETTAYI
jgi:hypothetical protein